MSECYLLKLQPMEPYFFGNEKTFSFDPQTPADNRYFIRSERMPLQTTVLGALRYLLMPVKNSKYRYTQSQQQQNEGIIGPASFQIDGEKQSFGTIEKISPLFLMKGQEKYVRTPFNHNAKETKHYAPLCNPGEVTTDQGEQWFYPDFSAKDGISDSYMNTRDGCLVMADSIFFSTTRVGISKGQKEKGFYKKQRMYLEKDWLFGAYVTLDTQRIAEDPLAKVALETLKEGTVVHLGQNKAAFTARIQEEANTLAADISRLLQPGVVYCLGDALVDGSVYDQCLFAATQLRDYRAYRTVFVRKENEDAYVGTVRKEACLYKLLCAGSVLIPKPEENIEPCFMNENCQQIGFNITVPNMED